MAPSKSSRRGPAEIGGALSTVALIAVDMARKLRFAIGIAAFALVSLLAFGSTVPKEQYLCAPPVQSTLSDGEDRSAWFRQNAGRAWYNVREAVVLSSGDETTCAD